MFEFPHLQLHIWWNVQIQKIEYSFHVFFLIVVCQSDRPQRMAPCARLVGGAYFNIPRMSELSSFTHRKTYISFIEKDNIKSFVAFTHFKQLVLATRVRATQPHSGMIQYHLVGRLLKCSRISVNQRCPDAPGGAHKLKCFLFGIFGRV